MKYDLMDKLREHLRGRYGKNTADKYYFAVDGLLSGLGFDSPGDIPTEEIERRMSKLKTKNDFSAAKCGLIQFKDCFPSLRLPDDDFFSEKSKHKRNFKKRKFEPVKLDTIKRKINAIKNKKLKAAYRLMLASGARVSEVAALESGDIIVGEDSIQINVKNGKGGKSRTIGGIKDDYLLRELPGLIAATGSESNIFYSASHMKNTANEKGFECHDLRRAFSKTYLSEQRKTEPDKYAANGALMEAMGHSKWRTTRIYLKRKIEI